MPDYNVVYAFSVFMEPDKTLPGFPAVDADIRQALPEGAEFSMTPPVVGLVFRVDGELNEDGLTALIGSIQGALEKNGVQYEHIDLTGAQRIDK